MEDVFDDYPELSSRFLNTSSYYHQKYLSSACQLPLITKELKSVFNFNKAPKCMFYFSQDKFVTNLSVREIKAYYNDMEFIVTESEAVTSTVVPYGVYSFADKTHSLYPVINDINDDTFLTLDV